MGDFIGMERLAGSQSMSGYDRTTAETAFSDSNHIVGLEEALAAKDRDSKVKAISLGYGAWALALAQYMPSTYGSLLLFIVEACPPNYLTPCMRSMCAWGSVGSGLCLPPLPGFLSIQG